MIKRLLLLVLLINSALVYAQTLRTDVLVVGGSASGVGAAIQCGRSKVKTILAVENMRSDEHAWPDKAITIDLKHNLPSGIWGEFEMHIRDLYKDKAVHDSSILRLQVPDAEIVLKKMTDTVKNLTVFENTTFTGIEKDGNFWEARFEQNGKTIRIKAKAVIDATEKGVVAEKAGSRLKGVFDRFTTARDANTFRTAIACGIGWPAGSNETGAKTNGFPASPAWYLPLYAIVASDVVNLFVTEAILQPAKGTGWLQVRLELGQGAATAAAFCAFYNTTTKNLRVRLIQGELLDFKGCLVPFEDITPRDPDWRAIQQVGATGLLKGREQDSNIGHSFNFMPDSLVKTADADPQLREIYTRAFLWFAKEKPGPYFTIGNMLSLISDYSLTDPAILRGTIQKAWKAQFKFTSDFELKRPVTRREFAVLANKYLNPFARTVDLNGRLVN